MLTGVSWRLPGDGMKLKKGYWAYIGIILLLFIILLLSTNIVLSESLHIGVSFNGKEQNNVIAVTVLNRSPSSANLIHNVEFQKYFYNDLDTLIDKGKGIYGFRILAWHNVADSAVITFLYDSKLSKNELDKLIQHIL